MDQNRRNQINSGIMPIPVAEQDPMDSMSDPNFGVEPSVDLQEPELSDINIDDEIDVAAKDMDVSLDVPAETPANEPMIPEGLNRQQILDAYRRLKPAQENYQNDLRNIAMMQGMNQISQGIARGYGANIGDGSEGLNAMRAASKEGVDAIGRELDTAKNTMGTSKMLMDYEESEKMNDPASDISKLYREQAYNTLKKMNPNSEILGKLDNMSASQLLKFPGLKGLFENQGVIKSQQADYFNIDTGNPVEYVPNVGYIDSVTRQPMSSGRFGNRIARRDVFGNIFYDSMSSGGDKVVVSDSRYRPGQGLPIPGMNQQHGESKPITPEEQDKINKQIADSFRPDKEQRDKIEAETGRLDTLTKNINEKFSAASRILGALDSDSKTAMSVIKTQMPRLAGEVGNLNQTEQEIWTGSQAILDSIKQKLETWVDSDITEDNKRELRKILSVFMNEADTSKNSILNSSFNKMEMMYGVPVQYTEKVYGTQRPVTERMKQVMEGKVSTPTNYGTKKTSNVKSKAPEGFVRMQDKSGKMVDIPTQNLEAAKARGLIEVK